MIDGQTRLVGLLGWPVEHSLSPVMQNAAFEELGLNWLYVPLPVRPEQIEVAIGGLAGLGFHGANVTVPHKQAALGLVDEADTDARGLGATNTLVIDRQRDGSARITGHNTDVAGFITALRARDVDLRGCRNAIVVGAGGAARAVVYGLLSTSEGPITVLNRSVSRAEALVADLGAREGWGARLLAARLTSDSIVGATRAADLLINATTVGMWPRVDQSVWPDSARLPSTLTVLDLVYNPLETRLLRQARSGGARALDGLEMLVQQGALAFGLWTGHGRDTNRVARIMRDACRVRLRTPNGG